MTAVLLCLTLGAGEPLSAATVGMSARLADLVIDGPELLAKEPTPKDPVVVRLVRVDPHGMAKRYTLEWYGLDPGPHDLRNYLRRADGLPLGPEVPPLPVRVDPIRPPGQVEPNALTETAPPAVGGYRKLVWAAVAVWTVGLVALLLSFVFPRRREKVVAEAPVVSLADRLRPLVAGAVAGNLPPADLAALERALLVLWRKRLGLESLPPDAALSRLHADPDAGPLLKRLEAWLHRPPTGETVDVAALLAPYKAIRAADLDLPGVARG